MYIPPSVSNLGDSGPLTSTPSVSSVVVVAAWIVGVWIVAEVFSRAV